MLARTTTRNTTALRILAVVLMMAVLMAGIVVAAHFHTESSHPNGHHCPLCMQSAAWVMVGAPSPQLAVTVAQARFLVDLLPALFLDRMRDQAHGIRPPPGA